MPAGKKKGPSVVKYLGKILVKAMGPTMGAALPMWLGKTEDGDTFFDFRSPVSFILQFSDQYGVKITFQKVEIEHDYVKRNPPIPKASKAKTRKRTRKTKKVAVDDLGLDDL